MKSIDPKECFKKHPMLHLLTGLGVGLVLVSLFPDVLVANALMLGIIAVVVGIGAELLTGQA